GNQLDPQRIFILVVRGGAGVAQRIKAGLLLARRGAGEARQLEHYPRTGIQLLHVDVQVWPFGAYLVLGACAYVGFPTGGELIAIAAEHHWRPGRRTISPDPTTTRGNFKDRRRRRCSGRCRANGRSCTSATGTRRTTITATAKVAEANSTT